MNCWTELLCGIYRSLTPSEYLRLPSLVILHQISFWTRPIKMSWKLNSLSWKLVSPSPMLQWLLKQRVSKRTVLGMSRVLRTIWMVMMSSFCYCLQLALVSVDTLFNTLSSLSCYKRMGQYVLLKYVLVDGTGYIFGWVCYYWACTKLWSHALVWGTGSLVAYSQAVII